MLILPRPCCYFRVILSWYNGNNLYSSSCILREALKNCVFWGQCHKGGWVLVSKPNIFYIKNYDIYQRVSKIDVIILYILILYIHDILLKSVYFQFHEEKGVNEKVWKLYFSLNPPLDFMEIEPGNTRDK